MGDPPPFLSQGSLEHKAFLEGRGGISHCFPSPGESVLSIFKKILPEIQKKSLKVGLLRRKSLGGYIVS